MYKGKAWSLICNTMLNLTYILQHKSQRILSLSKVWKFWRSYGPYVVMALTCDFTRYVKVTLSPPPSIRALRSNIIMLTITCSIDTEKRSQRLPFCFYYLAIYVTSQNLQTITINMYSVKAAPCLPGSIVPKYFCYTSWAKYLHNSVVLFNIRIRLKIFLNL